MAYVNTFIPFYRDVQLQDRIWFGKHRGKMVYEIIEQGYGWLLWAQENIPNFYLSQEAFNYLLHMEKIINEDLLQVEIPVRCSKRDILRLADNIITNAIEEGRILKTAEGLAVMKKLVEMVRDEPRFMDAVVDELERNSGRVNTHNGSCIELATVATKYDYSYDDEWCHLNAQLESAKNSLKEREALLKSVKEGKEAVDESTGELVQGATKTSRTSFKITLAR